MPTHIIVISWSDFGATRQAHWDYRKRVGRPGKVQQPVTVAMFDTLETPGELARVRQAVLDATGHKLKILLHGHGNAHVDFICSEQAHNHPGRMPAATEMRDLNQLADAVNSMLNGRRARAPGEASDTVVVMISCLFGRSNTGNLQDSSAWKLHRKLQDRGVFVELVARTEAIVSSNHGLDMKSRAADIVNIHARPGVAATEHHRSKVPYSKVRCKYDMGTAAICMWDYAGAEHGPLDVRVQRELWLYKALEDIHRHATDTRGNENHNRLINAVYVYTMLEEYFDDRDPDYFCQLLRYLNGRVNAKPWPHGHTSATLPFFTPFLDTISPIAHRSFLSRHLSSEEPKTKVLIDRIINEYH